MLDTGRIVAGIRFSDEDTRWFGWTITDHLTSGPNRFHARLRIRATINDNMTRSDLESPIGNIAHLARPQHRILALVVLTKRPRSRSEIHGLTDVSSSTIRRALDKFEDIEEDRFLSSHPETTPIQHDEFAMKLELRNAEFWRRLLDEITIIVDHQ